MSDAFQKLKLSDQFYAEGASFGDFNKDGKPDVIANSLAVALDQEDWAEVAGTVAGDDTALYNALLLTLRDAAKVPGRKVIIVFWSDS